MFQTAPGVTIPFPEKIQEQFQVYEGQSIQADISFEKLKLLTYRILSKSSGTLVFCIAIAAFYSRRTATWV